MWNIIWTSLALVCFEQSILNVNALDNGLALTPPMGWMSWQRYRCILGKSRIFVNWIRHKNKFSARKMLLLFDIFFIISHSKINYVQRSL